MCSRTSAPSLCWKLPRHAEQLRELDHQVNPVLINRRTGKTADTTMQNNVAIQFPAIRKPTDKPRKTIAQTATGIHQSADFPVIEPVIVSEIKSNMGRSGIQPAQYERGRPRTCSAR